MLVLLIILFGQDPACSRVTFCAVGDVLLDRGIRRAINDNTIAYPFELVTPFIGSYDLAFCNLECPVSAKGKSTGKIYCFRGDTSFFKGAEDAGFDIFSLANNHIIDWGQEACLDTRNFIQKKNLYAVGVGEDQNIARGPVCITKHGLRFAFFAYLGDPLKGIVWSEKRPGPAQAEIEDICGAITEIRNRVDYIIVSIHWGTEYVHTPGSGQITWAHRMVDAGADLIIGHHPHVLQSIEMYNDRVILYSLGNFVFDQHKTYQKQTGVFSCVFKNGRIDSAIFTPCYISDYRPSIAGDTLYIQIKDKIVNISKRFNTQFYDILTGILITDTTWNYSCRTPIAYYEIRNVRVKTFLEYVELRDTTEDLIDILPINYGDTIHDCCFISDTTGDHLILLINENREKKHQYIMHTVVSDSGFKDTWCFKDIRAPWKIQSADLTGDRVKELAVAVNTQEPHQAHATNKLRIFSFVNGVFTNIWNGSRRSIHFVDFICRDLDQDGLDELHTLEPLADNEYLVNTYQWLGTGFWEYRGTKETVCTPWIEDALEDSRR